MKRAQYLALFCTAGILLGASSVFAEPLPDPEYSDVLVLYSAAPAASEDPLRSVINQAREAYQAPPVLENELLFEIAAERVAELEQSGSNADANAVSSRLSVNASETVIRGKADLNTMISAILLSERQIQNLTDSRYAQFGYACNDSQTLWVLLLAESSVTESYPP